MVAAASPDEPQEPRAVHPTVHQRRSTGATMATLGGTVSNRSGWWSGDTPSGGLRMRRLGVRVPSGAQVTTPRTKNMVAAVYRASCSPPSSSITQHRRWCGFRISEPLALRRAAPSTPIDIWQYEPVEQRSLDDEALAHVYLATARLKPGEVEGAMDAVRPIIDLPEDRQISWIRKRMRGL